MQALILAQDPGASSKEIQSHLDDALAIARTQGARSLELRAVLSYARILAGRGERARARELLSSIYGSFAEGFETPDLEEAKGLLADLA